MPKRSTLMTAIGVTVFLIGGALVLLVTSSGGASGSTRHSVQAGPPTVVVATRDLTAGTSGDDVVREKLVLTKAVPANQIARGAITSLAQLAGQSLARDVAQNAQIVSGDLRTVAGDTTVSNLAVPAGQQAITISLPAAAGLSGVAAPGDTVNIYANVAKVAGENLARATGATSPCSQLVASNVQVLDVSPRADAHKAGSLGSLGGATGSPQVSFLLAVPPATAQSIVFFASNESLYLTLVPQGQAATAAQGCTGYAQQVHKP